LVYEGKLSFKGKAVYDVYIGKSDDANHGYEISLSAMNVLPNVNLSDDKPKSISGDLEFNVIEASTILSGSRKHEDLDEGRIQNEISRVAFNDYSAYNSTEVRIINTIPEFGYNILIDGEIGWCMKVNCHLKEKRFTMYILVSQMMLIMVMKFHYQR